MNINRKLTYKIKNAKREDGSAIYDLVCSSPPLDQNSRYLYLLLCSHFDRYTLTAKKNGILIGFVSAYQHPKFADALFIWQIAVVLSYRKQGVACEMVKSLVQIASKDNIKYIETTVTPSNPASMNMFKKIAKLYEAPLKQSVYFPKTLFDCDHEKELLLRIGPIKIRRSEKYENL